MTNEQLYKLYTNFKLDEHKVSSYQDYQALLKTLYFTEDDIHSEGGGDNCFSVTYGKDFNEDTDEEWSVYLDVIVMLDGELIISFGVSKHNDVSSDTIYNIEYTYKLESIVEVVKFAESFDFNEHLVMYQDKLYYTFDTVVDGVLLGEDFIRLEDGTEVYLKEIQS